MTFDLTVVLVLLGVTITMFAFNRPRMDAVALIMMTVLPLTGVISMSDALAGFSDPNIVLIALLFVIGEGLVRTGVAQNLGDFLVRQTGQSELRLIVLLMLVVAGVGAFMSSTGVVAIFIPIVLRIARNTKIAPGRLMMPLSIAGLMSGMLTLVATPPNLIVHSELLRQGYEGFRFFSFLPFGIPILALAILYMLFARRWLVSKEAAVVEETEAEKPRLMQWVDEYKLSDREYRLRLMAGSPWEGKALEQLNLRATFGINIVAIERKKNFSVEIVRPLAQTQLQAEDVLFLDALEPVDNIEALCQELHLQKLPFSGNYFADYSQEIGMAELMIPTPSRLIGKNVLDARFRSEFELTVIGIKRGHTAQEGSILNTSLHLGDTLLVIGPWRAISKLQSNPRDLIVVNVPVELDDVILAPSRVPFAVGVLALMVALMILGIVPNVQAALIACLLLGLFGCVDLNSAYRSIHWQSLILIVGMLPFSLALQNTGGIELAADSLLQLIGGCGPRLALAIFFSLTVMMGLFISNTATAVLMAPIALALAADMNMSPYPFAMSVALASSAAFLTPVSSPVNTLVVSPGNYSFFDFFRIGLPLTLIVLLICVVLVPMFFPF
jgi:di/tricarboxylate transporter